MIWWYWKSNNAGGKKLKKDFSVKTYKIQIVSCTVVYMAVNKMTKSLPSLNFIPVCMRSSFEYLM